MKLISLNVFDGFFYKDLVDFIQAHKKTTDIFLFQEVCSAPAGVADVDKFPSRLYENLCALLPEFQGRYTATMHNFNPTDHDTEQPIDFGKATFIREPLEIDSTGEVNVVGNILTFKPEDLLTIPSNFIYTQIHFGDLMLSICNAHGLPFPGSKRDTPDRLEQSRELIEFLNKFPGEKIIAGDFNLLPDTKSIHMIEEAGYRNLITDFGITTTRGTLNRKLHPEYEHGPEGFQEFADYTFVTPGVRVRSFEVPDLPISDHLPMILEFYI